MQAFEPIKPEGKWARILRLGLQRRVLLWTSVLLVLGLIVYAALPYFSWSSKQLNSTTAQTAGGGFEITMHIAPGPYFLGELLPVSLSIANHSPSGIELESPGVMDACGETFTLWTQGGDTPRYTLPERGTPDCPPSGIISLPSGHTISSPTQLIILKASGTLIVKSKVNGINTSFGDHGPSLQIQVQPHVPANHSVELRITQGHLVVAAPAEAQRNLVYYFEEQCGPQGNSSWGTNGRWDTLSGAEIKLSACALEHSRYDVGAPGYAVSTITHAVGSH